MEHLESDWRRLDRRMLLIHPFREVGTFLPALLGAAFAGRNFAGGLHQVLWPVAVLVFVIAVAVFKWFTTTYRFTSQQVQLRTGLLQRNTFVASTDKVRTVDVTASLLHRLLGLAAVEIGTGAGDKPVHLDGLPQREADVLRAELLQRKATQASAAVDEAGSASEHQRADAVDGGEPAVSDWVAQTEPDEVLYRLQPKWLLYAPLGITGLASASVIFGFSFQLMDQIGVFDADTKVPGAFSWLQDAGIVAIILIIATGMFVTVCVLAILGSAVSNFGFSLSRDHRGRTLHLSRGLLTTRSTSLEIRRLRGVEVRRPIPLRWFGGARLVAVMTGLARHDSEPGIASLLAPASPASVIRELGDEIVGNQALHQPLDSHGRAATRRRYVRAVGPGVVLGAGAVVGGVVANRTILGVVVAALLVVAGALLGRSRAHHLGHALTDTDLVTQSGSLALSTVVLERDATVAVSVRRSFFQRRAGLATVEVATAAGKQGYWVFDIPETQAFELAGDLLPR
ncbi:PH domain-containing protein [Yimella sp. cx-573]|nr:PH domain-containing protein [Yimella sp. cx-573]